MSRHTFANRYEVAKTLHEGKTKSVHLVHDIRRPGETFVLKVLGDRSHDTRSLWRFHNEYRLLSALSHPALPRALDLSHAPDGEEAYLLEEAALGVPLSRLEGPIEPGLFRDVVIETARVLSYLHGRGIVHFDVKPDNIVVRPRPDGRGLLDLRLVDFDLAGTAGAGGGPARGTVTYVAPEVLAGAADVDGRADLFSLGVTLAVLLNANEVELPGDPNAIRVADVLADDVATRFGNWVPDLIGRLLETDPAKRMPSARAVLELVRRGTEAEIPDETAESRLASVLRPPLISRLEELARLRDSMADGAGPRVPGGKGGTSFVLLTGERGVGKTRLLEEYSVALATSRVRVYRLEARPGHGQTTLGPIRELERDVLADQGRGPDETLATSPRDRLLPRDAVRGPSRFGFYDRVTRALLERARTVPVCLQADDVHLLDESSLEFLAYFARRLAVELAESPVAPAAQLVLSTVWERMRTPALRSLLADLREDGQVLEIALEPLDRVATGELVRSMLAPETPPAAAIEWIHERTHGNPFFVRESLANLMVEGDRALSAERALAPERLRTAPVATRVRGVVQGRVARVHSDDLLVLQLVALHPVALRGDHLAAVEGVTTAELARTAFRLVRRGLLTGSPAGELGFVDGDTRGVVVDMMSDSRRRDLHTRLAVALDSAGAQAWTRAYHRLESDDPVAGWDGASVAVQRLLEAGCDDESAILLRRILDVAPESCYLRYLAGVHLAEIIGRRGDAGSSLRLLREAGRRLPFAGPAYARVAANSLVAQGRFKNARRLLQRAASRVSSLDPVAAAELHIVRARTWLKQGLLRDAQGALDLAEELLARVAPVPVVEVPDDTSLDDVAAPPVPPLTAHYEIVASLIRLRADLEFKRRRLPRALALALLSLKMEARFAHLGGLGHALHVVGNIYMQGGKARRAEVHFNKAISLQRDVGDLAALADTLNNLGLLKKNAGLTVEAIELIRRSLQIRREIGNREGEVQCYLNIASTLLTRRELAAADRALKICLKLKRKLEDDNNPSKVLNNLGVVAQLRDRYAAAARYYQDARLADLSYGNTVDATRGQINLAGVYSSVGQYDRALKLVEEALRQARLNRHMQREVGYALRVVADVRRARCEWSAAIESLSEALDVFTAQSDVHGRIETLVDLLELHLAQGDHGRAERTFGIIDGFDRDVLDNELAVRLAIRELEFRGWDNAADVAREVVDSVITALKTATQRRMPGLSFTASAALARHFERSGEADRSFYYYSVALEALEATVRAIDDSGMMSSFLRTADVVEFTNRSRGFVDHFCPGISEEDGKLPADVRATFESLKKGFFDLERARGSTLAHLRRNEEGIRRILEASQALSSTAPMSQLLVQVVDGVIDFTGAERGFVILLDDDGELHIPVARTNHREPIPRPESQVTRRAIESIMTLRRPVILQNAMDEEDYKARESVINLELRSIMCAPMTRGEKLLGILYVDNRSRVGQFSDEDQELLAIFANQVAIAIENSRLVRDYLRDEKMRTMGMLAGGVAHDFNNLLAAILGRTQLLKEMIDDEAHASHLATIEKAANDGAVVVRRLQDFTRVSKKGHMRPVRVASIVDDVLDFTRSKWEGESFRSGRAITAENAVDDDVYVRGNPSELREVFMNIVLNAVDAMPKGGKIRFEARRSKDRVRLIVRDTGQGMSREVRDSVFDPFFTTKDKDGRGLGMSIVYGILMRHGGDIRIESEVGVGTSVIVDLPYTSERPAVETGAVRNPAYSPRGRRLLVADDETGIRELLRDILRRAGYTVVEAASGLEAVAALEEGGYDALLTDLGMVPMSGWEVAEAAKRLHPDMPVILVTGWAGEIDITQARSRHVDSVISKPFDMAELLYAVEEVIVGSASAEA